MLSSAISIYTNTLCIQVNSAYIQLDVVKSGVYTYRVIYFIRDHGIKK